MPPISPGARVWPSGPTMRTLGVGEPPAQGAGVVEPLVAAAHHQAGLLRGSVGEVEVLRPDQVGPEPAQPDGQGRRPLLDPGEAGEVAGVDVGQLGQSLEHGGGGDEAGDPVALDEIQDAGGVEPLHQHDGVAGHQVADGGEPVGVVQRGRHQHQLGLGQGSEELDHRRGDGHGREEHGRVPLDDDLRRTGGSRAAHPEAVGGDRLGKRIGGLRPAAGQPVGLGGADHHRRLQTPPAAGPAPSRGDPSASEPPRRPPSTRQSRRTGARASSSGRWPGSRPGPAPPRPAPGPAGWTGRRPRPR